MKMSKRNLRLNLATKGIVAEGVQQLPIYLEIHLYISLEY